MTWDYSNDYYLCIDLKSFYASVECVERGLDPMTTNLVVADPERDKGTICLAVSPSMKKLGVKNRCRVYEIPDDIEYIMAPPRMKKYIDYAAQIYGIYLDYISADDIHVYSIDEAFLYISPYLKKYRKNPKEMAVMLMEKVASEVGVRATCGIGTNLYLTKIALDITAKHSPDFIGILDEESYRKTLWDHKPLSDFWMIGKGIENRLRKYGITSQRGIANIDEDILYREFGINAELLIDHAWGRETARISDIKRYRPTAKSLSSGQVLLRDYTKEEAKIILKEMIISICLDLADKNLVCQSVTMVISYSYKVSAPPAHGTVRFNRATNREDIIMAPLLKLYEDNVIEGLPVRRVDLSCNDTKEDDGVYQMTLFDSLEDTEKDRKIKNMQKAILEIKKRFGKNALLKGVNLEEAATGAQRNMQIGGHKSGEEGKRKNVKTE